MKRVCIVTIALVYALCLAGCNTAPPQAEASIPAQTDSSAPSETTAPPETTAPVTPAPSKHSPLYIPGVDVEDVLVYFQEVCLDAEFVNSGNASLLQKWGSTIRYRLNGSYTQEDLAVLTNFTAWLNTVEGFPGIQETTDPFLANLQIHFCSPQEMLTLMGSNFTNMDGAVTFWYTADNRIYDAIICCRSDIPQTVRNSVILEELYNGLGPIQDTNLRPDSIIYSAYSEPQDLTEIYRLLLQLLYHPQLKYGMDAEACETVIRQLYY